MDCPTINVSRMWSHLLSTLAQGEKLELSVAIAKLMEAANMTERQGFKVAQVKPFSSSLLSFAETFTQLC